MTALPKLVAVLLAAGGVHSLSFNAKHVRVPCASTLLISAVTRQCDNRVRQLC